MKPTSNRRARRRYANGPQQEQKKDQKFFGGGMARPFFPPGAVVNRASDAKEEKGEEKASRAPEEKKEEGVQRAAAAPGGQEEKKEKEVSRSPEAGEEKKEEKVARASDPKEEQKEKKIERAHEEKKEEKASRAPEAKEEKREEKKIDNKGAADGAGETTLRYVEGIEGKGRPLPSAERDYFGGRMGFDFGEVRIHTGREAAHSAKDAGAKAYTYGRHIVFNEGRFDPGSHEGRHLLAHELTHVIQKGGAAPQGPGHEGRDHGGPGQPVHPSPGNRAAPGRQSAAPGHVHRDTTKNAGAQTAGPTDKAHFGNLLAIAIGQMKTPTVAMETLGGALAPVMKDMADNATWVDASGAAAAGADVEVGLKDGGRKVRLRLILDDSAAPPLTGRFDSVGADLGIIRVYVRDNGDPATLATTLYHESLHLMRWLAKNAPGGDLVKETGATGGRKAALEGIDPSRQPRHVAMVRKHVSDLASSVNSVRKASEQVDDAGIDRLSLFLMEEYLVRIETEVFRLMRDSDAVAGRPGVAHLRIGTSADTFFPKGDVDKYLFEIASVFRAEDRKALSDYDRGRIEMLYEYFRDRVAMFIRRRYSEVIHGPAFP